MHSCKIHIQLYTYTCRNIVNTIMTNEHASLEKYTSHTLFERVAKGLWVRGELETEQSWNILTPSSSGYSSTSFSFCWAAQSWGPTALCWMLVLSKASYLQMQQLTPNSKPPRTSCGTGLYNYLNSTCFSEHRICTQFNPSTVKVIPWYLRPDAPIAFHIALIPLGKVWIQLFSLQLWLNSWIDWVLQPWWGN